MVDNEDINIELIDNPQYNERNTSATAISVTKKIEKLVGINFRIRFSTSVYIVVFVLSIIIIGEYQMVSSTNSIQKEKSPPIIVDPISTYSYYFNIYGNIAYIYPFNNETIKIMEYSHLFSGCYKFVRAFHEFQQMLETLEFGGTLADISDIERPIYYHNYSLEFFGTEVETDIFQATLRAKNNVSTNFTSTTFPSKIETLYITDYISIIYLLYGIELMTTIFMEIYFNCSKQKMNLLLNLNGVNDFIIGISYFITGVLELLPSGIGAIVSICFSDISTNQTDIFMFSIYMILLNSCIVMMTMMQTLLFKNEGMFHTISFLQTIYSFLGVYATYSIHSAAIPLWIFRALCIIFPQANFGAMIGIISIGQEKKHPLSFSNLLFTSQLSYFELFIYLLIGIILYLFVYTILLVCAPKMNSTSLLPWRRLFDINLWRKLFNSNLHNFSENDIEIDNIRKEYEGIVRTLALDDLTLNIKKGTTTVLVGPNGSGKTTLIDIIVSALESDSGSIRILGENIKGKRFAIQNSLGVSFQEDVLFNTLSVQDHFTFFCDLSGLPPEVAEVTMEALDLKSKAATKAKDLSGGEKRRLSVGLALLRRPKVLILDEPTAGVDAQCRAVIWRAIASFEATALVTTHSLEDAADACTEVAVLRSGSLAFRGTPSEMRERYGCGYRVRVPRGAAEGALGLVRSVVPEAELSDGQTISLPSDLRIADAIEVLDRNKEALGLTSIAVSLTNLEDTLLRMF